MTAVLEPEYFARYYTPTLDLNIQPETLAHEDNVGAPVFPTLAGYPPTATIAALSCRTAEYILRQRDWFK